MKGIAISAVMVILVGMWSCKTDDNTSSDEKLTASSASRTDNEVIRYDHRYRLVHVDGGVGYLQLDDRSTAIDIPLGTMLKDLGERSEENEEVVMKGRRYIDPMLKINNLRSGEDMWIHEAYSRPVYAGAQDVSDTQALQTFSDFVQGLDVTRLNSGEVLLKRLTELKSDDIASNDAMFFMSYDYLIKLSRAPEIEKIIASHEWTLDDYNDVKSHTIDESYHVVAKELYPNGIMLEGNQGNIEAQANVAKVAEALDGSMSDAVSEYIDILKLAYKSRVIEGDNIITPLTSVVNQANLWTSHYTQYPDFAHAANTQARGAELVRILLYGTKNNPAHDYDTMEAKKEFRTIWTYVLDHYADTTIGKEVATHTKWLKSRNWIYPTKEHMH